MCNTGTGIYSVGYMGPLRSLEVRWAAFRIVSRVWVKFMQIMNLRNIYDSIFNT